MTEKKPMESKKFVAFLLSSVIWVVALVVALTTMKDTAGFSTTLLAMVISLGFIQALYIGGQAAVDTFVRIGMAFAQAQVPAAGPSPEPEEPTLGPDSL